MCKAYISNTHAIIPWSRPVKSQSYSYTPNMTSNLTVINNMCTHDTVEIKSKHKNQTDCKQGHSTYRNIKTLKNKWGKNISNRSSPNLCNMHFLKFPKTNSANCMILRKM